MTDKLWIAAGQALGAAIAATLASSQAHAPPAYYEAQVANANDADADFPAKVPKKKSAAASKKRAHPEPASDDNGVVPKCAGIFVTGAPCPGTCAQMHPTQMLDRGNGRKHVCEDCFKTVNKLRKQLKKQKKDEEKKAQAANPPPAAAADDYGDEEEEELPTVPDAQEDE